MADVPVQVPALENYQPHAAESGSIEQELIARVSHGHALYCNGNQVVYHYIEEAVCRTQYTASIKHPENQGWMRCLASSYLPLCR